MSTNQSYSVHIGEYATRHFIKTFEKKYHKAWYITYDAIEAQLSHIDAFLDTSKAEIIHSHENQLKHILKCEFSVAGTRESPHASGNRYIVFLDRAKQECHILLLYCKDHYSGQETVWWKQQIKENYDFLAEAFPNF